MKHWSTIIEMQDPYWWALFMNDERQKCMWQGKMDILTAWWTAQQRCVYIHVHKMCWCDGWYLMPHFVRHFFFPDFHWTEQTHLDLNWFGPGWFWAFSGLFGSGFLNRKKGHEWSLDCTPITRYCSIKINIAVSTLTPFTKLSAPWHHQGSLISGISKQWQKVSLKFALFSIKETFFSDN